jgi:hypothetical protein
VVDFVLERKKGAAGARRRGGVLRLWSSASICDNSDKAKGQGDASEQGREVRRRVRVWRSPAVTKSSKNSLAGVRRSDEKSRHPRCVSSGGGKRAEGGRLGGFYRCGCDVREGLGFGFETMNSQGGIVRV